MRYLKLRRGRVALRTLVVGTAALIGGAITVPTLMIDHHRHAPSMQSISPTGNASGENNSAEGPSFAANDQFAASSMEPMPSSSKEELAGRIVGREPMADENGIRRVRVFYATDRHQYTADDPHLWITTFAPTVLSLLLTMLAIAATFASPRRLWWGVAACVGIVISFFVVGKATIQGGTLYRLAADQSAWFSTRRMTIDKNYPLNLGSSLVSIPPTHREGRVEEPSIYLGEFIEKEERHIMIQKIDPLQPQAFFELLKARIAQDTSRSAFIYIHGYNVTFDEGVRRTAQLSIDLSFPGAPILYSWPSHGELAWYRNDQEQADWSASHLERFLGDIRRQTGVERLHIIAHSMGNRTLVAGLELLGLRNPHQQPMLEHVIMAAPDIDTEEFASRFADGVDLCAKHVTVYGSTTDRALIASVKVNGHQRLGLVSNLSRISDNVEIDYVDVTPIDTSLLGHSYYGNHPLMIREIKALLQQCSPPSQRHWLTVKDTMQRPPVWHFLPQLATGSPQYR